jgi:hypothetical protein
VFKAIKAHFSCSVWMNKDALTRKWEDIRVCTNPEVTYNAILELNQECTEASAGYSDFQVASKFFHLLQSAHDTSYIHLLTELARVGENASINQMWYIAQITWKQIKAVEARTPSPSQHLGMSAQGPKFGPCLWCTKPGHSSDRCYAKDPANLTKLPRSTWVNSEAPEYMKARYNKKFTQEEATKMAHQSTPRQHHQASVAWAPPPIYTAVPSQDQASTSTTHIDRHRQKGRYNFLVPEKVTEQQLAMPAQAVIGDGQPDASNLW